MRISRIATFYMDLAEIEANLNHADFQYRLKAIAALKDFEASTAVPLLQSKLKDPEFLVRSFVAMGLGKQQTSESFAALLQMMKLDNTPNVRAEAANSLSLFGSIAIAHLVRAFIQDDHWLVRRSILGALAEMDCPREFLEVCEQGLTDEDETVQGSAIDGLGLLAHSPQSDSALHLILELVNHESWRIRVHVAHALRHFEQTAAKDALPALQADTDHRVVRAALEGIL